MPTLKKLKIPYNNPMKYAVFLMIFLLSVWVFLASPTSTHAAENQNLPPPVSAAIELWKLLNPEENGDIFSDLKLNPVVGANAPLARYRPENGGSVEIGQNLRSYKRDYIYFSSPMDMSTKPDFNQYLAVMFLLNLSNEAAHILQNKNGSLKDFYKFYKRGDIGKACALYSLQQHVSDIMMLKSAQQAELLFLGAGSVKGINALRLALEKNDLMNEFEMFREAMKSKNTSELNNILTLIRTKRNTINMSGLTFCPPSGQEKLDKNIIAKAIEPVGYPFVPYQEIPRKSSLQSTIPNQ
jgi:hypothetical protein